MGNTIILSQIISIKKNKKVTIVPQFYDFGFPTPKVVEIRFYKAHIVNEAETELSIVANTERGKKKTT